jgi:hypothetical protein
MAILKVANVHFNLDGSKYMANTSNGVTFNTFLHAIDFNSTSDATLKDNIITIENPLEKMDHISGVTFNWKDGGRASAGVLAQQIAEVLPESVSSIDDHMTVNYSGVTALLIEAIKALKKEIEDLKNNK